MVSPPTPVQSSISMMSDDRRCELRALLSAVSRSSSLGAWYLPDLNAAQFDCSRANGYVDRLLDLVLTSCRTAVAFGSCTVYFDNTASKSF